MSECATIEAIAQFPGQLYGDSGSTYASIANATVSDTIKLWFLLVAIDIKYHNLTAIFEESYHAIRCNSDWWGIIWLNCC